LAFLYRRKKRGEGKNASKAAQREEGGRGGGGERNLSDAFLCLGKGRGDRHFNHAAFWDVKGEGRYNKPSVRPLLNPLKRKKKKTGGLPKTEDVLAVIYRLR